MRLVQDSTWSRRGFSLIWEPDALATVAQPTAVFSIRQMLGVDGHWPPDLPHGNGRALVVSGLDGVLDSLAPEDAETWLADDLHGFALRFQGEYETEAGLILWVPNGRSRIHMARATEAYEWKCAPPHSDRSVPLGRLLWSGAEADVARILLDPTPSPDPDGAAWIGPNIPRIS